MKNKEITPENMDSAIKELEDAVSGKKPFTEKTRKACIYISKWPARERKRLKNIT